MTAPPLAITQPDGSRRYVHPVTGETVPSVTTVIKVIADPPRLRSWKLNVAARQAHESWDDLALLGRWERESWIAAAPERESRDRVEAGNEVHAAVEALCKGQPVPELSRSAGWTFDRYLDFLISEQPEVLESEVTLWSRTHGYAGTADLVMRIRDATWLLDIKTGKNIYPEHGLQLAALASTDFIIREDGTEEPVPDITAQGVLHLRPRSWRVVVAYRQQECWETFLAARRIVRWLEEEAEEVLAA